MTARWFSKKEVPPGVGGDHPRGVRLGCCGCNKHIALLLVPAAVDAALPASVRPVGKQLAGAW
jgi:hypothetical protein